MALRLLGWVPIALLGCGRVGFDTIAPGDGAAPDQAVDGPLVPLCDRVAGAIYCSEFEAGDLAGADNAGATAAPGAGFVGDAFELSAAPGQMPHLGIDLPVAVSTGALHIGGRYFLDAGPPSPNFVVIAQVISMNFEKISFDLSTNDRVQLVDTIGAAGGISTADGLFPRGRWVCFELAIVLAPVSGGRADVVLDGVNAVGGFTGDATSPIGGWRRVEIGVLSSGANTATERIRFDNWIIATQPIGCP